MLVLICLYLFSTIISKKCTKTRYKYEGEHTFSWLVIVNSNITHIAIQLFCINNGLFILTYFLQLSISRWSKISPVFNYYKFETCIYWCNNIRIYLLLMPKLFMQPNMAGLQSVSISMGAYTTFARATLDKQSCVITPTFVMNNGH